MTNRNDAASSEIDIRDTRDRLTKKNDAALSKIDIRDTRGRG